LVWESSFGDGAGRAREDATRRTWSIIFVLPTPFSPTTMILYIFGLILRLKSTIVPCFFEFKSASSAATLDSLALE
jgi:hypothetical protein